MKKILLSLSLMLFVLPSPSWAEALDEESIRNLYAESLAAARDPVRSEAIMKDRLNDNFVLRRSTETHVGDQVQPPKEELLNKEQAINEVREGFRIIKIQTVENQIQNIAIDADRQQALVPNRAQSAGHLKVPGKDGREINLQYRADELCSDRIGLAEGKLTILSSDCKGTVSLDQ